MRSDENIALSAAITEASQPTCVRETLQWRHNDLDGVSNRQPHDCLLNRLFRRRSKKTSKLCVTGLCAGNSPWTGEFPAQRSSNAENVSIWWRHHDLCNHNTRKQNTTWPCAYHMGCIVWNYIPHLYLHQRGHRKHFFSRPFYLIHWGRVTHIWAGNLAIIGSDNGLSPGRHRAIIWTNAGILSTRQTGNKLQWNVNQNSEFFIQENAFEKVVWKMSAILSWPQCVKTNLYC